MHARLSLINSIPSVHPVEARGGVETTDLVDTPLRSKRQKCVGRLHVAIMLTPAILSPARNPRACLATGEYRGAQALLENGAGALATRSLVLDGRTAASEDNTNFVSSHPASGTVL